jgi:uncharacterized phage-like protein YoqJ
MIKMVSCKVCKLRGDIQADINNLIEQGVGYRRIAKHVIRKHQTAISYQSIKRHKDHLKANISNPNIKNKGNYWGNFHIAIGKIRSRY